MKKHLLFVALILVVLGTSGCIVVHTEKIVPCKPVAACEIDVGSDAASDAEGAPDLLTDQP